MRKPIETFEGRAYYDCPTTGAGLFDLPETYEVILRRQPARAEIRFVCHDCGEVHAMTFQGSR